MELPNDPAARAQARRNPDSTFEALCVHLAWHARTTDANDELQRRLGALDGCACHFERGFSIASVPIPFMLFGPAGVFLLQASRGFWSDRDIAGMYRAAEALRLTLEGYPDPVHCAIVMLGEEISPRQHFAGSGEGPCSLVSDDVLVDWLHSFDDHGLSDGDIAFLRAWGGCARVREPRRLWVPRGQG